MIVFPPAKINIGLQVTGKREDGYHSIESVFYPIPLCDVLELLPNDAAGLQLETLGISIPQDGTENLCQKAYRIINEKYNLPGMKAALLKNIPTGAGLGGGSSDGSAMINLINALAKLNLNTEERLEFSAQLGSDCPFFIEPKPSFISGRGEIIQAHPVQLKGKYLVLIHPNIHVPTAKAYSLISPKKPEFNLVSLDETNIHQWKDQVFNDFEPGIFGLFPELKKIKESLYELGAIYASMSGSGSSIYGIFDAQPKLNKQFEGLYYWQGFLN